MERVCGMLIPLVKSQKHPYTSLWNNILLNERFNHLKYKTEFYDQIFPQNKEKEWPSYRVFSSSLYDDEYEFYSLLKKYVLSSAEVIKYGKLRTKDGHIVSSKWISKSRNNYSVLVNIIIIILYYNYYKLILIYLF